MLKKFVILFLLPLLLSACGDVVNEEKGPPPLNPGEKEAFKTFMIEMSDQSGAHLYVGNKDKNLPNKLSQRAQKVRESLESAGCKLELRQEIQGSRETKITKEILGPNCPTFRVEKLQSAVSDQARGHNTVNGNTRLLFRPNASLMQLLEYQANYSSANMVSPRGGFKKIHSSSGGGAITFNGTRYAFKMGNDYNSDNSKKGISRQISWWEFNMGSFTAVLEQEQENCRVNGTAMSKDECEAMVPHLREVLDSLTNL